MNGTMRFFDGVRCSAYVHGARLRHDKKNGARYWNLTLAIAMSSQLAHACAEAIVSNYAQIATAENRCGGLDLDVEPPAQRVRFYAVDGQADALLSLGNWTVSGLRMAKDSGAIELWATLEHVKTDVLHKFVGDYAFTRVGVEFVPNAESPESSPVANSGSFDAEVLAVSALIDAVNGFDNPEQPKKRSKKRDLHT